MRRKMQIVEALLFPLIRSEAFEVIRNFASHSTLFFVLFFSNLAHCRIAIRFGEHILYYAPFFVKNFDIYKPTFYEINWSNFFAEIHFWIKCLRLESTKYSTSRKWIKNNEWPYYCSSLAIVLCYVLCYI